MNIVNQPRRPMAAAHLTISMINAITLDGLATPSAGAHS